MRVALQPAGSPSAEEHFENTIQNSVPYETIEKHLSGEPLRTLKKRHPEDGVPTWGVTPGKAGGNAKQWEKLEHGDVVLFAGGGEIFSSGRVLLTVPNPDLAEELWGAQDDEQTWEYIFFLDDVREQSIPYKPLNLAAGYKPNNVIQGFNVLDEDKSASILLEFEDQLFGEGEPPERVKAAIGQGNASPGDQNAMHTDFVRDLMAEAEREDLAFDPELLLAFQTGLTCQPFTLLAGPTGTGKTSLARLLDDLPGYDVEMVEVEGGWLDSASALGYISPATQDFVPGPVLLGLLDVLDEAHDTESNPVLLLDEINVSPPHVYLAPLLSSLEVAFSQDETQSMTVAQSGLSEESRDALREAETLHPMLNVEEPGPFVRLTLEVPPSLRVVGTLNFDASTENLAPKLLNRSLVVWFENPEVQTDLSLDARCRYSDEIHGDGVGVFATTCRDLSNQGFPVTARAIDRARHAFEELDGASGALVDILLSGLVLPQLQTVMGDQEAPYFREPFLEGLPDGLFKLRLTRMRDQLLSEGMANLWLVAQ